MFDMLNGVKTFARMFSAPDIPTGGNLRPVTTISLPSHFAAFEMETRHLFEKHCALI